MELDGDSHLVWDKIERWAEKRGLGKDLAVPWTDTSPADSRKVPVAAPGRFSFVGRQFGMTLAHVTFESSMGSKPLGT